MTNLNVSLLAHNMGHINQQYYLKNTLPFNCRSGILMPVSYILLESLTLRSDVRPM